MKKLKVKLKIFFKYLINIFIFTIITQNISSNEILIEIEGNNFTDDIVILSLIENKPKELSEDYSNYLLKTLDNSLLFEKVSIEIIDNKYVISILEYANINNITFNNNERIKDEDLLKYANELNLSNLNPSSINNFISEIQNLYQSFGYNNSNITYTDVKNKDTNTADIIFNIYEGKLTKISSIIFSGNNSIDSRELKSVIRSKTKNIVNIFANNNFKKFVLEEDANKLKKYYTNSGFPEVKVDFTIEYLKSNKVNIYFKIEEGEVFTFKNISFINTNDVLDNEIKIKVENLINSEIKNEEIYSLKKIDKIKNKISDLIIKSGLEFFEINSLEKRENNQVDVLYNIKPITPKYAKQINIYGNSRTFDKVIRRELELSEGDPVYDTQIDRMQNKLQSLGLFKSVKIVEKQLDNNLVDLEISVEETQTGTFSAGFSIGSLDGVGFVAGLTEKNFYGTGRSLKALINTTDDRTEFTFETTDRILYENDVDISYKANFKQEDFSTTSSYKLDTFATGAGIGYKINTNLRHSINLDYVIKDYKVTDTSTVASAISNSQGENISFILKNILFYNTLNSIIVPKNGRLLSYTNELESPTSSTNGYIKNVITFRNYKQINKNIISLQARLGNVTSLSNNDILSDDKFSLGGRWLRGFDSFGAGPRNSRTSYVGGNNLITTKLDYSRELYKNSDFPVFLNLFNDYGIVWENKTKPTNSDNSLRSSVGFGIKYYSPIGPIGFSWGFPIQDKSYDIKRMFLFSVGNID